MMIYSILVAASILGISSATMCQTGDEEQAKTEAWKTVRSINRHWAITENMDSPALFIHDDMIMIIPDVKDRVRGKAKIIESYRGYAQYAQTLSLKELNPAVQLYNNNQTAVVTYYYDLEIQTPTGEIQRFTGRDMYTFVRVLDAWIAVAQQFSPTPENK